MKLGDTVILTKGEKKGWKGVVCHIPASGPVTINADGFWLTCHDTTALEILSHRPSDPSGGMESHPAQQNAS